MVLPTTPFVEEIRGAFVRLTTCKRLTNNSLPKLSLTAILKNNQHCFPPIYVLPNLRSSKVLVVDTLVLNTLQSKRKIV